MEIVLNYVSFSLFALLFKLKIMSEVAHGK